MANRMRLGRLLVQAGLIDEADLARALEDPAGSGRPLGATLEQLGLCEEAAAVACIAKSLGLDHDVSPELVAEGCDALPLAFCRRRSVLPLDVRGRSLRVAVVDPLDFGALQDVEFRTGLSAVPVVVTAAALATGLDRLARTTRGTPDFDRMTLQDAAGKVEQLDGDGDAVDVEKIARDVSLAPVVRLVNGVLTDAARAGASDVHVEPQDDHLLVRYRLDGLLHDVLRVPRRLQDATLSRLKVIAGMDISDRRRPQDGRSRLHLEGRRIDLRISTLPTQFGEKVVVRLLDESSGRLDLGRIGFTTGTLAEFRRAVAQPQGMVLVTGPTGSGKTSTLHAALAEVASPTKNVITLEDPIEYRIPGLNQVQVNPRAGVTFASGLRSILRQDPNVVLVGEIRDHETAGIALEAAQTGHMLMSTLHANDAAASITRLIELGVDASLVACSLTAVLAQRLVRVPCPACARPCDPAPETVAALGGTSVLPSDGRWIAAPGCEACRKTGSRGRRAIHELLLVTDTLRDLVARRAPEHALREAARREGSRSLRDDGIGKAALGLTTLEEVLRVVPREEAPPAAHAITSDPGRAWQAAAPAPATRRVLIVDDSPTISTVVKYFLELEGYVVDVAADGSEGLAKAIHDQPDLVVTDVEMPGLDGLELVQALRDGSATRHAGIILLTSDDSPDTEARALDLGADDYVVKPVDPRRLSARIKAVLSRDAPRGAQPDDARARRTA